MPTLMMMIINESLYPCVNFSSYEVVVIDNSRIMKRHVMRGR